MFDLIICIIIGWIIYFILQAPKYKSDDHMKNNKIDFGKMNDDVILNGLSWRKTQDNITKGKYDIKKKK